MYPVRAFVDEYGDGSIGAGVRNALCHFLYDKRIAYDAPPVLGARPAVAEPGPLSASRLHFVNEQFADEKATSRIARSAALLFTSSAPFSQYRFRQTVAMNL